MSHRDLCCLFVSDLHDLGRNIDGLVSKFADNTKIDLIADNDEGCQRLQQGIDQLVDGV